MVAQIVDLASAATPMGLADWCTQAESDSHTNRLVVEPQAQAWQRECMEPAARVRAGRSKETGSVQLVGAIQQVVALCTARSIIPGALPESSTVCREIAHTGDLREHTDCLFQCFRICKRHRRDNCPGKGER